MMQSKLGVLMVNLGTPDAPTPQAVKRYLAEFLSDRRVVDTSPCCGGHCYMALFCRFAHRA